MPIWPMVTSPTSLLSSRWSDGNDMVRRSSIVTRLWLPGNEGLRTSPSPSFNVTLTKFDKSPVFSAQNPMCRSSPILRLKMRQQSGHACNIGLWCILLICILRFANFFPHSPHSPFCVCLRVLWRFKEYRDLNLISHCLQLNS